MNENTEDALSTVVHNREWSKRDRRLRNGARVGFVASVDGERTTRGKRYDRRCSGDQESKEITLVSEEFSNDAKRKRAREEAAHSQYKVLHRDSSLGSSEGSSASHDSPRRNRFRRKPVEIETDPVVLARRQKQIDYGKNTIGYDRYCRLVPKDKRERHHPDTPPKHVKYSRRGWDNLVKIWRQKLHGWDNPEPGNGIQESPDIQQDNVSNTIVEYDESVESVTSINLRNKESADSITSEDCLSSPS